MKTCTGCAKSKSQHLSFILNFFYFLCCKNKKSSLKKKDKVRVPGKMSKERKEEKMNGRKNKFFSVSCNGVTGGRNLPLFLSERKKEGMNERKEENRNERRNELTFLHLVSGTLGSREEIVFVPVWFRDLFAFTEQRKKRAWPFLLGC